MADPRDDELRRARQAAYRLLARRARSVKELEDKLAERRFSPATVRQTLERLSELGYLDDEAFARSRARYLMETRPMGRRRLAWELSRAGLDESLVDEAVDAVWHGRSERQVARELAARRLEAYRRLPALKAKRRLHGYLSRRGFSQEVVRAVLEELCSG